MLPSPGAPLRKLINLSLGLKRHFLPDDKKCPNLCPILSCFLPRPPAAVGAQQGVAGAAPVDLGTAFARGQLQDACAKAVFAQRALDPEHGLLEVGPELGAGGHGSDSRARDPTPGVLYAMKTALPDSSKVCLRQEARNIIW
ncbi:unnamed protein product [Ectocarpus sp. CCAP 1310/34]|nr:unnamed protein product [Ectocarpus sp. CCAP 1310/34]